MDKIRKRFLEVFDEDEKEKLTLKLKLRVNGQDYNIGDSFRKDETIGGVDFHIFRYFDIALEPLADDVYQVTGVYSKK